MNNLLIWPLSEHHKVIFSSLQVSLSNITCCDSIHARFQTSQLEYQLLTDLKGCALITFKEDLLKVINKLEIKADLSKSIKVFRSSLDQILIEINDKNTDLAYFVVDFDTIQTWISQLELLGIVMQENENEKKSRGSGCC